MSSTVGPAAVLSLVRQRNFGPYFGGNALSASGGWFQNLAASLLVYQLTHSAFLLGVLNFCQFAPVLWLGFVFLLLAGFGYLASTGPQPLGCSSG
jgi:hypothetical protein